MSMLNHKKEQEKSVFATRLKGDSTFIKFLLKNKLSRLFPKINILVPINMQVHSIAARSALMVEHGG